MGIIKRKDSDEEFTPKKAVLTLLGIVGLGAVFGAICVLILVACQKMGS